MRFPVVRIVVGLVIRGSLCASPLSVRDSSAYEQRLTRECLGFLMRASAERINSRSVRDGFGTRVRIFRLIRRKGLPLHLTYARFSELSSNHRTDLNVEKHHGGYPQ